MFILASWLALHWRRTRALRLAGSEADAGAGCVNRSAAKGPDPEQPAALTARPTVLLGRSTALPLDLLTGNKCLVGRPSSTPPSCRSGGAALRRALRPDLFSAGARRAVAGGCAAPRGLHRPGDAAIVRVLFHRRPRTLAPSPSLSASGCRGSLGEFSSRLRLGRAPSPPRCVASRQRRAPSSSMTIAHTALAFSSWRRCDHRLASRADAHDEAGETVFFAGYSNLGQKFE